MNTKHSCPKALTCQVCLVDRARKETAEAIFAELEARIRKLNASWNTVIKSTEPKKRQGGLKHLKGRIMELENIEKLIKRKYL